LFVTGVILTMTPFIERSLEKEWSRWDKVRTFVRHHIKDLRWIGLLCVLYACYQAWDIEHKAVDVAINGLDGKLAYVRKYNQCNSDFSHEKTTTSDLRQQLGNQQNFINSQQGTVSNCVLALGKLATGEPGKVLTFTHQIDNTGSKVVLTQGVLLTTKRTHLQGTLTCDHNFKLVDWRFGAELGMMSVQSSSSTENSWNIRVRLPDWEPNMPVMIFMASQSSVGNCFFTQ
jgi:hypothetical protein